MEFMKVSRYVCPLVFYRCKWCSCGSRRLSWCRD